MCPSMEVLPEHLAQKGCDEPTVLVSTSKVKDMPSVNESHEKLDEGYGQHGCSHYRRRCRIRAPCCNEIFDCRHCHNEAKNAVDVNPEASHDIPRHEVQQVICSICGTEQDVKQICVNCGVCMGKYFCEICKFYDDDLSKQQYHCDGCGICRTGGRDNFFHCYKCGRCIANGNSLLFHENHLFFLSMYYILQVSTYLSVWFQACCYSVALKDCHPCVERAMHHNCPVCFEFLFESTREISVLPCGHTIHMYCLKEMHQHLQFSCPVCSKSVCDMSRVWEKLDEEVAATPMPTSYQNKKVWILCNDCGTTSEVKFHILAHKCANCNSYNTRQTRGCSQ